MKINNNKGILFINRVITLLFVPLFLSACAIVPDQIRSDNVTEINAQDVRGKMEQYKGKTVRWGGVITQIINNADNTWIELLALNLNDSGRPSSNRENNYGRFIAKIDRFMDPEVYQEGYSFTVIGIVTEEIEGKIGEHDYKFPVVSVQGSYMWQKRTHRYYPPIIPGYWYYGYHPYWRFGYSYYGYGVRFMDNYYPYYPIYGHLERNHKPLSRKSRPGHFQPDQKKFWPRRNKPLYTELESYSLQKGGADNVRAAKYFRNTNNAGANNSRKQNAFSVRSRTDNSHSKHRSNTMKTKSNRRQEIE